MARTLPGLKNSSLLGVDLHFVTIKMEILNISFKAGSMEKL